jgi:segregation and condensation protein B
MASGEGQEPTTPEDLGRTYAAMLGEGAWDSDMPPEAPAPEEPATPPPPLRIIEALLFVGGAPLTAKRARETLRGLTQQQFDDAVNQLNADYRRQGRPYLLQPQGAGWLLTLRPRYRPVIEKLYGGVREARLSTAAIDVLAVVAYRQPIAKGEIDNFRGADSGALLRQLVRRGLIQVMPAPGKTREVLYTTTQRFLEMFGLASLDDLPKTHDLQQL